MKSIIVILVIASVTALTINSVASSGSKQIQKRNASIEAALENIK